MSNHQLAGNQSAPLLGGMLARALHLGASAAAALPARDLVVADHFAALCAAPHRCPSYGLAPGCPPHAQSPARFAEELRGFEWLLAFRVDAPATDLLGAKRLDVARRVHRLAATLEGEARRLGWQRTRGLAAGSCFELYCADQERCAVLVGGACPHADRVRPSLSAVGVDFTALATAAGWSCGPIVPPAPQAPSEPVLALLAGLVLLAG